MFDQGCGTLGPDPDDLKELRVLNRILRWKPDGIHYEAGPRHAELLARDLIKTTGPIVRTAGTKNTKEEEDSGSEPLAGADITSFRSGAARANYVSLDRAELAYATKEICRRMSAPRQADWAALVRIIKYLKAEPRLVNGYKWQHDCGISVYVDTDFAGCLETSRSTSGGCAFRGSHLIMH